MDDIWSTKVLDDVRNFFPNDRNGSRIMLTTRLSDVASYVDSSPYTMPLMDEKTSWDLLKQRISRDALSRELEMIGHEIARSCRGLPLAIVVIAGILSSVSETPASWAVVAENVKEAASKDDRMVEVVSLGYNHLPHRLRACLLYMGFLPEDYKIKVSLLVKLWIAEGFLKHNSSKSMEADAEEYLEDLVRRNLILVTERRKYNGKIKRCNLHDMVRETCIRLLKEENHLRHVTTKDNQGDISKRSVLRFTYDDMVEASFVKRFRLLRVLHVNNGIEYDSRKMSKLYRLRHLCFNHCDEQYLPADLSHFQNLQSLIIECGMRVPPSIWKLRQLRHLVVDRGFMPPPDDETSSSGLEKLQTLKNVEFDEMTIKSLERVLNLIKLGLCFYSSELHVNESLVCLRQLEVLKISCYEYSNHLSAVFPESLKKYTQEGGRVSVGFLEAIGSLPNLQVLKLRNCNFDNPTWEVRGGDFPKLKMLQLSDLEQITTFNIVEEDGSTAFPMLNCLRIDGCFDLVEFSDEIGDIPMLQLIEVYYCKPGVYEWARRVEKSQQDLGNYTLRLRLSKYIQNED